LIALVLHLQHARIFEKISRQGVTFRVAANGQNVPNAGQNVSNDPVCFHPSKTR
jgi:hypothetical protein